jgi:competence protein ComGC
MFGSIGSDKSVEDIGSDKVVEVVEYQYSSYMYYLTHNMQVSSILVVVYM